MGLNSISAYSLSFSSDDRHNKVRKPYTVTKSRESWSDPEHDKFLEALQLFDRDWKKIEAFVGSKSVIQIRSHAQKYFMKVQKSGTSEHVPPPRPKRKAAHPYPQKAPKTPVATHANIPFQSSAALQNSEYIYRPNSLSVLDNQCTGVALSSWSFNSILPINLPQQSKAMPDFGQVYSFIGSIFDPNESGYLQRLRQMDSINMETVLLLMRNLAINLTSPRFEHHRRLLLYDDDDSGKPFNTESGSEEKK